MVTLCYNVFEDVTCTCMYVTSNFYLYVTAKAIHTDQFIHQHISMKNPSNKTILLIPPNSRLRDEFTCPITR